MDMVRKYEPYWTAYLKDKSFSWWFCEGMIQIFKFNILSFKIGLSKLKEDCIFLFGDKSFQES